MGQVVPAPARLEYEQQKQGNNQREQRDGFGQGKAQNADAEHVVSCGRVARDLVHQRGEDVTDTNAYPEQWENSNTSTDQFCSFSFHD